MSKLLFPRKNAFSTNHIVRGLSMTRCSRRIYVAALTALVYVIIFSVSSFGGPLQALFSGVWGKAHEPYSFDEWAKAIFRQKVAENKGDVEARMAEYTVDGSETNTDSIELPLFLLGEGENPHLSPHDPRFTFGVLLRDFNARVSGNTEPEALTIDYFHWADWTDLSVLDRKILSVKDSRATCESLNAQKHERNSVQNIALHASKFCYNDADIERMLLRNGAQLQMGPYLQRIADAPYRTGLHVHRNPARASQRVRKMAAASYLHDFMHAPKAVNFILPSSSELPFSLYVPVYQSASSRVRLVDTPLATAAAKTDLKIHLREELAQFRVLAKPAPGPKVPYLKELKHEDFVDRLSEIVAVLSEYDNGKFTNQDQQYLDSLRYSLNTKVPTKYFYEALLVKGDKHWQDGGHHDWRFFKGLRQDADVHMLTLHGLILAWLRFTNANSITTWIAHGSLLGWYWNGLAFPWDEDYDVQVPIADLHKLARKFNQTIIADFGGSGSSPEVRLGRYFLDCGTWISHREAGNGLNNIDARFIDMDSGLYIDITGLAASSNIALYRYNEQRPMNPTELQDVQPQLFPNPQTKYRKNDAGRWYSCRNRHVLSLSELSPLTLTLMEGVPAYIPHNFTHILQTEYGQKAIRLQRFVSYAYMPRLRLWGSAKMMARYIRDKHTQDSQLKLGAHMQSALARVDEYSIFHFSDQNYLELMAAENSLLFAYLLSNDTTLFHQREMEYLLSGKSSERLLFGEDGRSSLPAKHLRPDLSNYMAAKNGEEFSERMIEYVKMYRTFKSASSVADEIADSEEAKVVIPVNNHAFPPLRMQTPEEARDVQRTRPDFS